MPDETALRAKAREALESCHPGDPIVLGAGRESVRPARCAARPSRRITWVRSPVGSSTANGTATPTV